jgi:hypothetical protein
MENVVYPKGWGKPNPAVPPAEPLELEDVGCGHDTLQRAALKLAESGLTLDDAAATGMFPTDDASSIHPDFAEAPALVIPYLDAAGGYSAYDREGARVPFCRVRYLPTPGWRLPKDRRYDQAGASGTRPYFPRSEAWARAAAGELDGVVVVEGELKAAALSCAGIPAVAIGGVDCFGDGATAALHPALATLARQVPDIYIVFDSDAAEKARVQAAEWRFAGQLALAGGRPHIVRLPPSDDGQKIGADDYLVAQGPDALLDLINAAPVVGAEELTSSGDVVSLADLMAGEVKPVPELIPGWLEKGIVTFLAGQGGVHKSRLALEIGLCLNAGVLPPGLGGTQRAQIARGSIATLVYVSAEDGVEEIRRRAQMIAGQLRLKRPKDDRAVFLPRDGKDCALVVIQEGGRVEFRPFYHELTALLCSIPGPKLVVLDSAYDFARWTGKTKVEEDAVNWFIKTFLKGICDQCDSTLLIPWHPSQAGSERDDMSGWSVAWHNAPRARWGLKAAKDVEDAFELSVTKRSHGQKAEPVLLRFHEGALLPAVDIPDDGREALQGAAAVKAALRAAEMRSPFTQQRTIPTWALKDVSAAAGKSVTSKEAHALLQTALAEGRLAYRVGTSKERAGYYPPDEVAAAELARRV